ncbi:MAG: prephenate dehydrogenase [Myxococcota bacterium]|nr:prephenate dehydrogenase [Myxococcota bacterium]
MKRLGIIGAGLIGASLVKFWSRRGIELVVVETNVESHVNLADIAPEAHIQKSIDSELSGCDLIVVAVPLGACNTVFTHLASVLTGSELVIDVAGVKERVQSMATDTIGDDRFIGCHPMAGHAGGGLEAARPDLFMDARVACCNPTRGNIKAQLLVSDFWEAQGALPIWMTAEHHDAQVAWTSHLPYTLSALLMNHLEEIPNELIGPGFLRSTRYADFSTEVMGEVITHNPALLKSLEEFIERLRNLKETLETSPQEALSTLEKAHQLRQSILKED